jgi:hypothetical protein
MRAVLRTYDDAARIVFDSFGLRIAIRGADGYNFGFIMLLATDVATDDSMK